MSTLNTPAAIPAATREVAEKSILPTLTFGNLKLLIIDDKKTRDRDATLRLGADGIDVLDGDNRLQTVSYREVLGLYHSHSREPRWTTPDGNSTPVAKTTGKFGFLKGTPDWITVRTKRVFIPLRVREDDLTRLTGELESRTGSKVVTTK